jgi:hypothetical protein
MASPQWNSRSARFSISIPAKAFRKLEAAAAEKKTWRRMAQEAVRQYADNLPEPSSSN